MTDSDILNGLLIQTLTIQEDKEEEKSPEITDTLLSPPEASAATPMTDEMKQENIMEEKNVGRTDRPGKDATERGRRVCHLHCWTE